MPGSGYCRVMTTPHEPDDPFANPKAPLPPDAQSPQPPTAYPPPTHIVVSAVAAPTGLARWTTILTGAVALLTLAGALTASAQVEELKTVLANPDNASPFAGQNPLSLLTTPLLITSFVLLALWMSRVRSAMTARGEVVGGPPAVEWWGWFVPLANFVLPLLGMLAIARRKASIGSLIGWWVSFCLYWVLSWASVVPSITAVDLATGELANPDALNAIVPIAWGSALSLIASWVFLANVIRQTTAAEKSLSAQANGSPF